MYAVGGMDDTRTPISSVECFDPSTAQWSPGAQGKAGTVKKAGVGGGVGVLSSISTARWGLGVAVVDF